MSTQTIQNPMGAETPIIKTEIKKQTKTPNRIQVSKDVYNIIRSFVESSPKPEYEWNTGIDMGNYVMFVKQGKWILKVWKEVRKGDVVAELESTDNRYIATVRVGEGDSCFDTQLYIGSQKVGDFDVIVADVSFARPIFSYELRAKFLEYFDVTTCI